MNKPTKVNPVKSEVDVSDPGTEILIWKVPVDLKARFKAECARRGISMRDAVLEFIRTYGR